MVTGLVKASVNPTVGCVKQGWFSLPLAEPADYISEAFRLARSAFEIAGVLVISGDCKAFSATALLRSIRIIKCECPVQSTGCEVNPRPLQIRQAVVINNYFDTLVLEDLVISVKPRSNSDFICPTGASGFPDPES